MIEEAEGKMSLLIRFLPECAALTLAPLLLRRMVLPTLAILAAACAATFLVAHKASLKAHEALKDDEKHPPASA